jgi:two-component system, cell cycle response regulator
MGNDDPPVSRCILVVDDDPALRRFLEVALRRSGFVVETAQNGAEAVAALLPPGAAHQRSHRVDAVLLDALLPDIRGFDLARRLITEPATATLPICFLTGAVHGRFQTEAGVACVLKPTTHSQLAAALSALLDETAHTTPDERLRAVDHVEELAIL